MYTEDKNFYVARSSEGPLYITGKMANRHGLIAGATGTETGFVRGKRGTAQTPFFPEFSGRQDYQFRCEYYREKYRKFSGKRYFRIVI